MKLNRYSNKKSHLPSIEYLADVNKKKIKKENQIRF